MFDRFPRGGFHRVDGVGHDVFHVIFGIALLALVVLLAIWLVQSIRRTSLPTAYGSPLPGARADAALEEARVRYARGDITREQFLEISRDLGGPVPPPEPPAGKGTKSS
jgi:uncharacterized membrane protein